MKIQDSTDKRIKLIKGAVGESRRILVTSHIRPDGDAVGSLLGFGLALIESGKVVDMVLEDGVPDNFNHLYGSSKVQRYPKDDYDLVIVLDCSDYDRVGSATRQRYLPDINIDHHQTNVNFATTNYVIDQATATAEILAELIPNLGLKINQSIANALLSGIVTDTIGFRTTNVTTKTMEISAELMRFGADLSKVYFKGISERSIVGVRYWGLGLIKLVAKNGIVWTSLTLEDRDKVGYHGNDDADLINLLSSLESAKIALIFIEQDQGRVKISWRLCGSEESDLDVSNLALDFGGGGHKSAAGAMIEGTIEEVREKVLERTQSALLNSR